MPARREEECFCADGISARESGEWARTKLDFLDYYLPPALEITRKFPRRWFLDLFAGPGCNVDRHRSQAEFWGSPIRALGYTAAHDLSVAFTDAVFINKDSPDHEALRERVSRAVADGRSRLPLQRIRQIEGDANEHLPAIMGSIARRDYVFAFADITGPEQWPFSSVRELKRLGHQSVDFYMLFPLEMALNRQMAYDEAMTERNAHVMSRFFDGDEWREIWRRRRTAADTNLLKREITELYLGKLRTAWTYAEVQATINKSENRPLYRMIFATNEPLAQGLAAFQKRSRQRDLFPT